MATTKLEQHKELANKYIESKQWDLALQEASKVSEIAPDSAMSHLLRARIYFGQNDIEGSDRELQRAQAFQNDAVQTQITVAGMLIEKGRYSEAMEVLQQMIRAESPPWQAYYNLGVIYVQQERHEAALVMFWRALLRNRSQRTSKAVWYSFLDIFEKYQLYILITCVVLPLWLRNLWGIPFTIIAVSAYLWAGFQNLRARSWLRGLFDLGYGIGVLYLHGSIYYPYLWLYFYLYLAN